MNGILSLLARVAHVGVDSTKPRQETKHIVLTNVFAVLNTLTMGVPAVLGTPPPYARAVLAVGAVCVSLTLLLNRLRAHVAASAWLLVVSAAVLVVIGLSEPESAGHALFLVLGAATAWFMFPPWERAAPAIATVLLASAALGLTWAQRRYPAVMPPSYDGDAIALGNHGLFAILILAISIYAAREMARVERELVAEREKSESILKREVSHQVAERSRELGKTLALGEAPLAVAALFRGTAFTSATAWCARSARAAWERCTKSSDSRTASD